MDLLLVCDGIMLTLTTAVAYILGLAKKALQREVTRQEKIRDDRLRRYRQLAHYLKSLRDTRNLYARWSQEKRQELEQVKAELTALEQGERSEEEEEGVQNGAEEGEKREEPAIEEGEKRDPSAEPEEPSRETAGTPDADSRETQDSREEKEIKVRGPLHRGPLRFGRDE